MEHAMSPESQVGWPAAPQHPSNGFPDAPAPARAPTIEGDGQPSHELKNMEIATPPEAQVSAPTATQHRPSGVPDAHIDEGPAPAKAFATEGDGQPADGPPKNKRKKSYGESQLEIIKKAYEFDKMGYRRIVKKYAELGFTKPGVEDAIERLKKNHTMERHEGSGRPAKCRTAENLGKVKKVSGENPKSSAGDVIRETDIPVRGREGAFRPRRAGDKVHGDRGPAASGSLLPPLSSQSCNAYSVGVRRRCYLVS